MVQKNKTSDIIIVGAGVTGTSTLIALIDQARKKQQKISITLIDKNATLGPGLPYQIDQHKTLRINDPTYAMSLRADKHKDFDKWLHKKKAAWQHDYPETDIEKDRFVSRSLFGRYCHSRLEKYLEKAEAADIEVKLLKNTTVLDIDQTKEGWSVSLENGDVLTANSVVMAMGHMPSEKYHQFDNNPQYYASPWADLDAISAKDTVFVLGSGLSAIDAAKLLNAKQCQKIYMLSPSGALPSVKGPKTLEQYTMQYLTPDNLNDKDINLEKFIELVNQEIMHATGNKSFNIESALNFSKPAKLWLSESIDIVSNGKVRTWQILLDEIYFNALPIIWKHFSNQEKQALMKKYYGPYIKWAAGTPMKNAKELLKMILEGKLKVIKLQQSIVYNEEQSQFEHTDKDGTTITAKFVINGTGQGHNARDIPLLCKMIDKKLISSPKIGGGITTNSDSYRVINCKTGDEYPNLYAAGPLIFGSNIAVYAVEASAVAAKRISENVLSEIQKEQSHGVSRLANAGNKT